MSHSFRRAALGATAIIALVGCAAQAQDAADNLVADWIELTGVGYSEWLARTPETARPEATVALAMFEAVNAIEGAYIPFGEPLSAPADASARAAVAAAAHDVLAALYPARAEEFDAALAEDLSVVPDGPGEDAGVALGAEAAAAALARIALDPETPVEPFRAMSAPGVYVPTEVHNVIRDFDLALRPWVMSSASEFRPEPPPALTSERYARDLDEVRRLGGAAGSERTQDQDASPPFWFLIPMNPTLRTMTSQEGRSLADNARLYAMFYMATDDAWTASADGKAHYLFWRPITALRNADRDGNDATTRVADWTPRMPSPMHPEYPCAHCVQAAAHAVVLDAEAATPPEGGWVIESPAAPGETRRIENFAEYSRETSMSRIYAGAHYRFSNEAGEAVGRAIGARLLERFARVDDAEE